LIRFVVSQFGTIGEAPTSDALEASFDPTTVKDAEARHSVESGFDAAGPGGFLRALRSIQPEIHAAV
jgi:hypothetical protein